MRAPDGEAIRPGGADDDHGHRSTASWADVTDSLLDGAGTTWLSVPRAGGVHTRPVFAAWTGSSFVFATNPGAAKTTHLRGSPTASLAIDLSAIHLVVEETTRRLRSPSDLAEVTRAMREVYHWPTEVTGEHLDAPYAAPTSGGPPFEAWELAPVRAFAFPTQDQVEPTRFIF